MHELNLPSFDARLKRDGEKIRIFDTIRKKYVACTPEEWVRQHFMHYLISVKNTPTGLIVLEKQIVYNTMTRRPDILVYDRQNKPVLIVECKAPDVPISQDTFDQIARYNSVIKAPFLVVTNGLKHYCCKMDHDSISYRFLEDIPGYGEMLMNSDI
ncbi:MAG: type I restriction enzyme HsdR N-terminal domain-containing protein [Bacteroidales bacterium]|jgi:hypothetical protein|nr:type I restriction enzyme HsdR N-terminal domain-containing protein [Bacteroidales bacterium]